MTTQRPPVLVLGSGLTALGCIRLLHKAGYDPYVVTNDAGMARRSRWFRAAPPSSSNARPVDDLPAYLDGLPFDRAALLPCSDAWMLEVAGKSALLPPRFRTSISSLAVLSSLIDKWHLASLLQELRLPHPRTHELTSVSLAQLPDDALVQSFIKPRDSGKFFERFQAKAFRVSSRAEIATRLAEVNQAGLTVQLQEYVPGPADNHYYVEGFLDRDGKTLALFARRRLRMYPPDFGNSTFFQSVSLNEVAGAVDTVLRLLTHVRFRGIFSVEFKRDERDGVFRLIEVNARPWWFIEFAGQCGINFCELSVRDALDEPGRAQNDYVLGKRCIYPYYDFNASRDLHREGQLTLAAWAASMITSTQPVFRWSDPWPAVSETGRIVGDRLSRILRKT